MKIEELIISHPVKPQFEPESMISFLCAATECEQACLSCADACLAEEQRGQLVRCISICQDCADICAVAARLVSRRTSPNLKVVQSQVQALATACAACREECRRHASSHEHCRVCAEACGHCEEACAELLRLFPLSPNQDSR